MGTNELSNIIIYYEIMSFWLLLLHNYQRIKSSLLLENIPADGLVLVLSNIWELSRKARVKFALLFVFGDNPWTKDNEMFKLSGVPVANSVLKHGKLLAVDVEPSIASTATCQKQIQLKNSIRQPANNRCLMANAAFCQYNLRLNKVHSSHGKLYIALIWSRRKIVPIE